jgi:hypothetical protein
VLDLSRSLSSRTSELETSMSALFTAASHHGEGIKKFAALK